MQQKPLALPVLLDGAVVSACDLCVFVNIQFSTSIDPISIKFNRLLNRNISSMEETNLGDNSLSPQNPVQPEHGLASQDVETGSVEYKHTCTNSEVPQYSHEAKVSYNPEKLETQKGSAKNSRRLSRYGKKVATRNKGKRYLLRSSFTSTRVLRSMLKVANGTSPPSNTNPVNLFKEKGKRRRKVHRASNDEFSKFRKTVRYLLHRMSYEQSLIDAYAGEGWKGQSSEKIKPEMELQRAKSEILRCKLKIRNVFQQLDSSISEGKLDNSLFDSEGEICSEDISCAKCRSKDISAENDIVLCDGICDRGFHQKCLDPPLLNVPPGDESWLCPGCDCKVDCMDLINETHGGDLSIEDEWEKVFPEAAAFASRSGQHDDGELPSDDSEDHDYDPDSLEADEELKEGSSSDESDFPSASEDSGALNHDQHDQNFGFPSDDSEDIDYDPDKPDVFEKDVDDASSSDESDFTSDTDDLNIPDNDAEVNEVSVSPTSKDHSGKGNDAGPSGSLESELGQECISPLSSKRQRERLDYKKLCDEAYGNQSSDSSDDEEWTEMSTPKNLNCNTKRGETEGFMNKHVETVENRNSKRVKVKRDLRNNTSACADMNENGQTNETSGKVQIGFAKGLVDEQSPNFTPADSDEKAPQSSRCKYGAAAFQKLQESFRENQYPKRDTKESLARELGMTAQQVSKWFDNARHSLRVSAREASPAGQSSVIASSCRETSKNNISIQEAVGSEWPNVGRQVEKVGESHHVGMSEAQEVKNGRAKPKAAIGEASSREMLVMRELRKRRKSK